MTTHHMSRTTEYQIWNLMLQRCLNASNPNFHRYGGRGILVTKRWASFENFYADMGPRPEGMQLDRIDNDGPYIKRNCRWISRSENCRNRRDNVWLVYDGERKTVAEWAEVTGIKVHTLYRRVYLGWSDEEVITRPVRQTKRNYALAR